MADLFRQTRQATSNTNGSQRSVTYRATVRVTTAGVRAITEAFGPDLVIEPDVVIGTAFDGAPCLIVYDELSRPWMIAGVPAAPLTEGPASVLMPKGEWQPGTAYPIDSVVSHAENTPIEHVNYFASADVPANVEPPALPWKPLINAFEPDMVVPPTPTVDFTYVVAGTHRLNFTGITNGTSPTYAWNFGDGVTATGATPSHTFSTAGNRTVTLTVTANGGITHSVRKTVVVP